MSAATRCPWCEHHLGRVPPVAFSAAWNDGRERLAGTCRRHAALLLDAVTGDAHVGAVVVRRVVIP